MIIIIITSGNSEFSEVEIKQGIFQGDSLYPLVFVLALILIEFDFKKGRGSIWVFRKQRED